MKKYLYNEFVIDSTNQHFCIKSEIRNTPLSFEDLCDSLNHHNGLIIEGTAIQAYNFNNEFYFIDFYNLFPLDSVEGVKIIEEIEFDYDFIQQPEIIFVQIAENFLELPESLSSYNLQTYKSTYISEWGASGFEEIIVIAGGLLSGVAGNLLTDGLKQLYSWLNKSDVNHNSNQINVLSIRQKFSEIINVPINKILYLEYRYNAEDETHNFVFKSGRQTFEVKTDTSFNITFFKKR